LAQPVAAKEVAAEYTSGVKLRVRLFASFRVAAGTGTLTWEAPDDASVSQVVAALRAEYPAFGPTAEKALLAVNQEYVVGTHRLKDGDELALIPPVSGG
jgi:molybdopterin synthase catalytic subunit